MAPKVIWLGLVIGVPLGLYLDSRPQMLTYELTPEYQYDLLQKELKHKREKETKGV